MTEDMISELDLEGNWKGVGMKPTSEIKMHLRVYKENINEKAIFYNIDLTDRKLFDVFDNHDIEKVIHLGAQIDVTRSVNDPIYDSHVNIQGSINLFQACVKHETEKVVYASSAAVYGEPNYLPINEKHRVKAMSP